MIQALAACLRAYERETLQIDDFRSAAVLVPILQGPAGLELLFTVRAGHLRSHAGQIAFPGGALDEGEDVIQAALRESQEEIGLKVEASQVLGFLDDHPSPASYIVTPVVAVVDWPQRLEPNPHEVQEVFTVPISDLRQLTPRTEERQLRQYRRTLYYYDYQNYLIWGLTGNVLKRLLDLIENYC